MADRRLQANPSEGTFIWWSNGSINSTFILPCEDIELNQTLAMNLCCKNGPPLKHPVCLLCVSACARVCVCVCVSKPHTQCIKNATINNLKVVVFFFQALVLMAGNPAA